MPHCDFLLFIFLDCDLSVVNHPFSLYQQSCYRTVLLKKGCVLLTCLHTVERYSVLSDELITDEVVIQNREPDQSQLRKVDLELEALVKDRIVTCEIERKTLAKDRIVAWKIERKTVVKDPIVVCKIERKTVVKDQIVTYEIERKTRQRSDCSLQKRTKNSRQRSDCSLENRAKNCRQRSDCSLQNGTKNSRHLRLDGDMRGTVVLSCVQTERKQNVSLIFAVYSFGLFSHPGTLGVNKPLGGVHKSI